MDELTIRVGGHEVAAHHHAGDRPAVVVVPALGQTIHHPGKEWDQALAGLETEVWTFDRPATGYTKPRPSRQALPYSAFADELSDQLDAAGVAKPVVLVGHSFGALISLSLAHRRPEVVAGAVFVDPSLPGLDLGGTPAAPWIDGDDDTGNPIDVSEAPVVAATALRDRPAMVLTRASGWWYPPGTTAPPGEDARWHVWHADLAARWGAPRLVADRSGHQMQREASSLVGYAIRQVVECVREGRRSVEVGLADMVALGASVAGGQ